ncbi:MAG: hypothetical protein D6794_10090, partial [Deltaproteobacteria bacterium]
MIAHWLDKQSLTRKILSPFFLLLTTLGLVATLGVVYQTRRTLIETIDQSLYTLQVNMEQTLRGKEDRLRSLGQVLAGAWAKGLDPEQVLAELDKTASLARQFSLFQTTRLQQWSPSMARRAELARTSGRAKLNITTDATGKLSLVLLYPLGDDPNGPILVGRDPLRTTLLTQSLETLNGDFYILDTSGNVLAGSRPRIPNLGL